MLADQRRYLMMYRETVTQAQVLAYFDTGGVSNGGMASFAQASAKIATKPLDEAALAEAARTVGSPQIRREPK